MQTIKSWYTIAYDMQTRLISFRILNWNYWTPVKMSRLGIRENVSGVEESERGTLIHMFYETCVISHM